MKWTPEVDNRRVDLIEDGYTYPEIARILNMEFELNFTDRSIEARSRKTNTTKSSIRGKVFKKDVSITEQKLDGSLFPEEAYQINEEINFTPEKKRRLKEIYEMFTNKEMKILSLSDLHAPFIDFKAVEAAIKDHYDADLLVLNGDVFDGHALSDFDKRDDFDIEIEFKQVFMLLDVLTKKFEQIVWVGGNHDFTRFIRYVSKKFGNGMKKYVMERLNPITYIAEKYDNLIIVPHNWVQIGKAIFTHPDGYSSALMSTAMNQAKYLNANAKEILPNPEFHCVVQGHTHDLGEYYVNGTKIIEQGCLCTQMDYRFDKPSSRKWVTGYAVIHLDENGNVDFNWSRNYLV